MDNQKNLLLREMTQKKALLTIIIILVSCGLLILFVVNKNLRELVTGFLGLEDKAILTLSPATGTYHINDQFDVDVLVNTKDNNVVAVGAYLNYNPAHFEVISIDTNNSVFQTGNNCIYNSKPCEIVNTTSAGKIEIIKAKPTPGVNTDQGLIATITFEAKAEVSPTQDNIVFEFSSTYASGDSDIILDDKQGSDILSGVNNAKYIIESEAYNPDLDGDADTDYDDLVLYIVNYRAADLKADVQGDKDVDYDDLVEYILLYRAANP